MSKIQIKLAAAAAAYEEALQALVKVRERYENGTGKAYAEICVREEGLKAKIAQHRESADAAQAKFKRLFADAGHVVTKEVKGALAAKNDALAIIDELNAALQESEHASLEPMLAASSDAQRYQTAHAGAFAAYARLQVYEALAECESTMSRAMALAQRVPLEPATREPLSPNLPEARMALVWEELKAMVEELPAGTQEMPQEVGVLNLGPFADRAFISVAAASQMRKARAVREGGVQGQPECRETPASAATMVA